MPRLHYPIKERSSFSVEICRHNMGTGSRGERDVQPSFCKCGSGEKDIFLVYYIEDELIRLGKARFRARKVVWTNINLQNTACSHCLAAAAARWVDHGYRTPAPLRMERVQEVVERRHHVEGA